MRKQVQVVIINASEQHTSFLVLKRVPEKGGFWQAVTGGVETGEDFEKAAKREAFEETGLTGRLVDVDYMFEFKDHNVDHIERVYALVVDSFDVTLSKEHTEFKWCDYRNAYQLLKYDSSKRAFSKAFVQAKLIQ